MIKHTENRNWYGVSSVGLLFAWFLIAKSATNSTVIQQVALWVLFGTAHVLAIISARTRQYGWIYLLPIASVWGILVVSMSGSLH